MKLVIVYLFEAFMILKRKIKKLFRKFGVDIVRYNYQTSETARLAWLLKWKNIEYVLDVGANEGQYAQGLIDTGFKGNIISIEPTSLAYQRLQLRAKRQRQWKCLNIAMGESEGRVTINIAANSESSSILNMLPLHERSSPSSFYIAKEEVPMMTVDQLLVAENISAKKLFLKIDAQGYESKILAGAPRSLSYIQGVELEMSLTPLYNEEKLFYELDNEMKTLGFALMSLEPVFFSSATHQVMQLNGIYFRLGNML
jgi:FkbM family methyltransferase